MSELIRTILIMSISGGIIALLLFILKPLTRNHLPKSAQYYLWLLVIAALLVPVSRFFTLETPLISETVGNYAVSTNEQIDANQHLWLSEHTTPQGEYLTQSGSVYASSGILGETFVYEWRNPDGDIVFRTSVVATVFTIFMFIYPIGVGAVLLYYIISYSVFTRLQRRRNSQATADENAVLAKLCGERRSPFLYRNPLAATPMLFGVFRPAIIIPDREYTDAQIRAVLLHELTHLRRKDVLVKWLSVLALAVHWFNPIVWLVRREIDRTCELSCDEAVVRNLDADGKQNYGDTLLYVAAESKTPKAVLSTTMCEEKKALKERLGAIMKSKKHTRIAVILSAVMIFVVGGTAIALGAGTKEIIHNFNGIVINDISVGVKATEVETIELYGNGIKRLTVFRAYLEGEDDYVIREAFDINDIRGIEGFFGKGAKGTYDEIQGLKYARYTGVNGVTVTFIFIDGIDNGIENRLVRAVITPPTSDNSSPPRSWWEKLFVTTSSVESIAKEPENISVPLTDTVTVIIQKDSNGGSMYSLFDGGILPAPSEIAGSEAYKSVDELNAALAEYPQDTLRLVQIKHTMDFTKDEMIVISDMVKVPSDNYSKAVGLYEFQIKTLEEARGIVSEHYPNAAEIRYTGDDTISYTNPPAPVDVYSFEVDADGVTVICAVSKERGIFFTYNYGGWYAFTGLREWSSATRNITLDDVRAIAQKIGTDLTMDDLRDYIGEEIGSGLYIMRYYVEDSDYILTVGSGGMVGTVMYATLTHATDGGANESIDIRYYDVDKFIKDETKELVRPLPEPQETTPPTALSEPPLYEIGKVAVNSNDIEYAPYEHFLYSLQVTENGQLAGDGTPLRFEDVFALLPEIQYSEDFRVDIIGNDIGMTNYSLYDDKFEIIYERESALIYPDAAGVYILCVNVTWSNNATDSNLHEYTGLRYIFKIVKQ